jgi:dTDP-4-dehydrorhamnose reductase
MDIMENKQTKIFGIGASGLIGSRVAELLADSYPITNLSSETGFDIRKSEMVDQEIGQDTEHSVVVLFAAKTDVDGCEKDKETDQAVLQKDRAEQEAFFRDNPTAWAINAFGTQNVVDSCRKAHKKLIYISTDFVFDGNNPPPGGYKETDVVSPTSWYGQTKYEGEKIVEQSGLDYLIIRTAFPYRSDVFALKKDLAHIFLGLLEKKHAFKVVADALIQPTFVDDFAMAVKKLLDTNSSEIFHVVGSQSLTAYDAVLLLAKEFGFDPSLVGKNTAEAFYQGRAPRPYNSVLNNDKIQSLGVKMRTFAEGIKELKR